MIKAQLSDLIEVIGMLKEAKSAGISMWEAIIIILFILRDLLIVGGILGTIVWLWKNRHVPKN